MRSLLLLALLWLPVRVRAQATESPVRGTIDRWVTMWNSYNLNEVDSLFVADETVSYFSSEYRGLIRGRAALKSHHERFGFVVGGKPPGNRLWLEDVIVDSMGPGAALVTAIWKFQRVGADQVQSGPVSFALVDRGLGYRILHAHFANHPAG